MTNLEKYWNILKHVETYWNIIQMFIAFQIRTWWCTCGCFLWRLKEIWSLTSPNIKIQVPVPKRRSRNGLKEHVQNWIYFTMLRKHDQTSFLIRMSFQRKHQPAFSSAIRQPKGPKRRPPWHLWKPGTASCFWAQNRGYKMITHTTHINHDWML